MSSDPLPTPPPPLTPSQQRARRAAHHAFLMQEQQAGRLPRPQVQRPSRRVPPALPPTLPPATPTPTAPPASQRVSRAGGAPAGKRFHAHELRRVPVEVTPTARALIDASSAQGRLLPQALAEVFGEHPDLVSVCIDAVEKARHFAVDASAPGRLTRGIGGVGGVGGALDTLPPHVLRIDVTHVSAREELAHGWFINAHALSDLHPQTRLPRFVAERAARELLRLYREHEQRARARDAALHAAHGDGGDDLTA